MEAGYLGVGDMGQLDAVHRIATAIREARHFRPARLRLEQERLKSVVPGNGARTWIRIVTPG